MGSIRQVTARGDANQESATATSPPRRLDKNEETRFPRTPGRIAHAHYGMLVTALLLGIGLIAATWTSWRDAEALGSSLDKADLVGRSQRNFALGIGVTSLLAGVAVGLWRRAQREEALAEKHARRDRLAALETMSAVLAHEINNPLAALKGNAQLVAEALPDGSHRRAQAERVVDASIRLQELIANLLDFIREGPLSRAPVDPAEILFLAAEDAAPKAELELETAPPSWSLDAVQIRQVLENLLRNATQAAEGGRVFASVSLEDDALVYAVRDEGPGLPKGSPEVIFEPFFTTKTRGVGLGLTVARRIAELHGGELTARSRPEGGAEFRVVIPRE